MIVPFDVVDPESGEVLAEFGDEMSVDAFFKLVYRTLESWMNPGCAGNCDDCMDRCS